MRRESKNLLDFLNITPDPRSVDFVNRRRQFQLHSLLTEQRHPLTWNLSFLVRRDVRSGLESILAVDADVVRCLRRVSGAPRSLEQAALAVRDTIREGRRIFIYGCGSTGRLAVQMESALWRPFWDRLKKSGLRPSPGSILSRDIVDSLVGGMTGGDRALVSALEGFEDLALVGEMQLRDRGLAGGDAVFCISEGGETSSVIGALETAAARESEPGGRLFFMYNNPDELLLPFDRSREALENPVVERINLTTGPQAVAGSTRMQAATSETWVMGRILESGIHSALSGELTREDLTRLGFPRERGFDSLESEFSKLRQTLGEALDEAARFTELESDVYQEGGHAVYFACRGLIPVFVDCAERSPTFHLFPLDPVGADPPKSRLRVWTAGDSPARAWHSLLGRDFRGLAVDFYAPPFRSRIQDPLLREAALSSLERAGTDQKERYDFSMSARNLDSGRPGPGDLGVAVILDEEIDALSDAASPFAVFIRRCRRQGSALALILAGEPDCGRAWDPPLSRPSDPARDVVIRLPLPRMGDPLGLRRQTLLKMLLNAHSTAVMARLGRVVGNTMTHVSPGNLKLVGRATSLIMSHVNDTLADPDWIERRGVRSPLTYSEANAVLYDAMHWVSTAGGEWSEVELSILRILESLRRGKVVDWASSAALADDPGLQGYLARFHPSLRRVPNTDVTGEKA